MYRRKVAIIIFIVWDILVYFLSFVQVVLLFFSEFIFCFCFKIFKFILKTKKQKFVVGTREVAKNIFYLKKVLKDAYSVNLLKHSFYSELEYDFGPYPFLFSFFISPILLAYLSNLSEVFIYLYDYGFLLNRSLDFAYLKLKNKKIVLIFVGDDVRSLKKCKEFFEKKDMDTFCNYYEFIDPVFVTDYYERKKKKIAEIAEKYADVIFDYKYGQYSYLSDKTYVYRIPIDVSEFPFNKSKFRNVNKLIVLHAPSSPIIKGTQLVRAAIKKLFIEGYVFEYKELINTSNSQIKKCLLESHIVLNQFYALGIGLFGLEAMAAGNVVLMSANPDLNPDLPQESKQSWVITHYWEIYDNLKNILENTNLLEKIATNARNYVEKYHSLESVRDYMFNVFKNEGII